MRSLGKVKNIIYLSLTALIWGVAFVFQSMGNNYMQPFTFTSARYLLGCVVLIPLVIIKLKRPDAFLGEYETEKKTIPKKITAIGGICCGLALGAASVFQQYGVKYTTVGKAGFITTLYIVLTPIFGLFINRKCPLNVWISAAIATVGLYMLCMTESFSLSFGDTLVFICAVLFSVHILIIDHFSPMTDGVVLSCIQFFVSGTVCGICALIFEHPSLQNLIDGAIPALYTGIMSSGVAYTFQILGQKNFNPTIAAMIMSLESVISTVAGYLAFYLGFIAQDQRLTSIQLIGCAVMFAAVIFAQIPMKKKQNN